MRFGSMALGEEEEWEDLPDGVAWQVAELHLAKLSHFSAKRKDEDK